MSASHDELQILLNRLLMQIGRLQRENPDPADFWPLFAGQADVIVDAASPTDYHWVTTSIDAMLTESGLVARHAST